MATTDAQKRASAKYRDQCKLVTVRLHKERDADVIRWLEERNATEAIKELVRNETRR